jgi:DNA-binding LacI/PurR family transcriptional regulator
MNSSRPRAAKFTIKDVAKAANVSPMTASRALHHPEQVAPATRARVLKACQRLQYRPNASARTLRTSISKHIGVIVPDLRNSFWIEVVSGIEQVLAEAGFDLLIGNSNEELERLRSSAHAMAGRAVDGLLIAPTVGSADVIKTLQQEGHTLVLLDRRPAGLGGHHSVVIDNEAGAYAATRHLIDARHERIGLLAGNINVDTGRQRLNGYQRALRGANLSARPDHIRTAETNAALVGRQVGYRGALELLDMVQGPTAILCTSSTIAVGALSALQERRVRIPDQVALVTFGDPEWASLVNPPLTVVTQPTFELGRQGALMLLDQLNRDRSNPVPMQVILEPQLLVRASSGPRRERSNGHHSAG